MKNTAFWDVIPCRFVPTYQDPRHIPQGSNLQPHRSPEMFKFFAATDISFRSLSCIETTGTVGMTSYW
jgi:hypothetical protein